VVASTYGLQLSPAPASACANLRSPSITGAAPLGVAPHGFPASAIEYDGGLYPSQADIRNGCSAAEAEAGKRAFLCSSRTPYPAWAVNSRAEMDCSALKRL
jgi:hypothetical protein